MKIYIIAQSKFSFISNTINENSITAISKITLYCSAILLFLLNFSCAPQSKESYLEDYGKFMNDVAEEKKHFTDKQWAELDEKHEKFTGEWYDKFEEDFTFQDLIVLKKNEFQYNFTKINKKSSLFLNVFQSKDAELLKERIKYYKENDMNDDLELLKKQADEMGVSATIMLEKVLVELNKEIEK